MDCAHPILNLEVAATETEFIEVLKNLTVTLLKTLSKEISVKISGSKTELIGQIITYWGRFLGAAAGSPYIIFISTSGM